MLGWLPFGSALLDEAASWLVRYGHPVFAYAKIAGFLLLETSLAVLIGVSLWAVFAGSQRHYAPAAGEPRNGSGGIGP